VRVELKISTCKKTWGKAALECRFPMERREAKKRACNHGGQPKVPWEEGRPIGGTGRVERGVGTADLVEKSIQVGGEENEAYRFVRGCFNGTKREVEGRCVSPYMTREEMAVEGMEPGGWRSTSATSTGNSHSSHCCK